MNYLDVANNKIIGKNAMGYSENGVTYEIIHVEVSDEIYNDYQEDKYIYQDGQIILNPNWDNINLARAKQEKYQENDTKAEEARTNKTFVLTLQEKECEFDTKAQTQTDLLTAYSVCATGTTYDGWICNNGVEINLTLEDVVVISGTFKQLSNVYPHWNYYKNLIDKATTIEELPKIDYNINIENIGE